MFEASAAWLCHDLSGRATCLHVRWLEDGRVMKHDESYDEPLDPEEADSILALVEATLG
jgi:hypothetical protein